MYQATPFQLVVSLKLQFVSEHFLQQASVQVVIVISVVQDQSFRIYRNIIFSIKKSVNVELDSNQLKNNAQCV